MTITDALSPLLDGSFPTKDPTLETVIDKETFQALGAIGCVTAAISVGAFAASYVLVKESINHLLSLSMQSLFEKAVCATALGYAAIPVAKVGFGSGIFSILVLNQIVTATDKSSSEDTLQIQNQETKREASVEDKNCEQPPAQKEIAPEQQEEVSGENF